MCLYPVLIQNRKYIPNKKNGGIVPPLPLLYYKEIDMVIEDKRVLSVPVGCGKCIECMKQKAREWTVRLQEEIRENKTGVFVTLTFSNESIRQIVFGEDIEGKKIAEPIKQTGYARDNEIATIAVRRFLERWRKKYKKSVRHWLVTELGHNGTENIHLHGIIWCNEMSKSELRDEIEKIWKYGYIYPKQKDILKNYIGEKTINYIVKYVSKIDQDHKEYKPKILTSQGIGKNYLKRSEKNKNKYKGQETNEKYKTRSGHEMAMPIYYRNKIYTDEEKEQLWLNKLDKNIRWVNGEKATTEEEYYKLLRTAREKNSRLGYGDNEVNWTRRNYENEQRNIKFLERIKKKQ